MKSVPTLLSVSLSLLLSLNSCNTDREPEPCQAGPLPVSSLEASYGCTYTRTLVLSGTGPTIMRSQAEFDQQVKGECHPQIDFTKYDLIIGQRQELGGAATASASYDYQLNCSDLGRVLRVQLKSGLTYDLGSYTYHVLVPKLAPTETVKVEVQVVQ